MLPYPSGIACPIPRYMSQIIDKASLPDYPRV